jgi:hypothetical protein
MFHTKIKLEENQLFMLQRFVQFQSLTDKRKEM